jgi:AraC-like DNA-binding protein
MMRPQRDPVAFHLAYQLIDPAGVSSERGMFAQAVNSVIDGFVPARDYVQLASRHEASWRQSRSEQALEERARLLIDCSLNPVALAGRSLRDVQALQKVSNLFHSHEALVVKTKLNLVGNAVEIIRDTQSALPGDVAPRPARRGRGPAGGHGGGLQMEAPPPVLAWEQLSVCQDAVACLIDVTRQMIGQPDADALQQAKVGTSAPRGAGALTKLGQRLGQQHTAVFALIQALEEDPALTLEDAAKALGCSNRTLQRHLQAFGVSLPRTRLAANLLHAIRLLAEGRSLNDCAHEAGFFDYPHFARTFKRSCGFLPSSYQGMLNVLHLPKLQSLV